MNARVALVLSFFLALFAANQQLLSQQFTLTPYLGFEAEGLYSTQGIRVEDMVLNGDGDPLIDVTFGLRGSYHLNNRVSLSVDINRRSPFLYSYIILHPVPPPFNVGKKAITMGAHELTLLFAPEVTVVERGNIKVTAAVGVGPSFFTRYVDEGRSPDIDFGTGYESLSALWTTLKRQPEKTVMVGSAAVGVHWRRFSLQTRYLKTLSRSVTDPLVFNGKRYTYINKRDGLQLFVGYGLPIGRKGPRTQVQ